jgi:phage terminase large subunit GpA-like protein
MGTPRLKDFGSHEVIDLLREVSAGVDACRLGAHGDAGRMIEGSQVSGQGRPIWPPKGSKNAAKNITLYILGVDQAKSTFYP